MLNLVRFYFFDKQRHFSSQDIPKQSVYFTYYLYAASYMLRQSSAYNLLLLCLLLYCVYVYHYFVEKFMYLYTY